MTESDLYKMSTDQLIDLMMIWVNELVILHKVHDHEHIGEKRKEVELIQRIIVEKRDNETSLKYIIPISLYTVFAYCQRSRLYIGSF